MSGRNVTVYDDWPAEIQEALVANDIVVNYRRYLGMDGGDPSPNMDRLDDMPWDSITAPDDSTVRVQAQVPHASVHP